MALEMPKTVKAQGNKVIVFLTTPPAASDGIPTVTEINAGLYAGCYIYGDVSFTPTQDTGAGQRKMCTTKVPNQLGNVSYPAVPVEYSYSPQDLGTPGSDGNELYEALVPGTDLTAVELDGMDGKTDTVAAADVADIFLVRCGIRAKGMTGTGEYDDHSVKQSLIVVDGEPIAIDHVLA